MVPRQVWVVSGHCSTKRAVKNIGVNGKTLSLLLLVLTNCERHAPAICRTSPPERSENYQDWVEARDRAHREDFSDNTINLT